MPRLLVVVLLAGLLAACGFQLRGQARLPAAMSATHVAVANANTGFVRELELMLRANGVEVVEDPGPEAAMLRIDSQSMQRRPLSVSGRARVREYVLIFEVAFDLVAPGGEVLIDDDRLRLTRDYSFDEQEILAAAREEEFLREDLGRAMAARLVRRLEAVSAP